jgi:hypothetical protein
MTSFLYNHLTTQWDAVQADDIAPNVYRIPNLPGDEEQYLEIPATVRIFIDAVSIYRMVGLTILICRKRTILVSYAHWPSSGPLSPKLTVMVSTSHAARSRMARANDQYTTRKARL